MENTEPKPQSFLDRTLASLLRLDIEKILWILLLIVALLSRTIGLGDRAMSHDESLHTVYSWQLFDGRGYQHQPMMHGPLKFILNPVMYFLFGVNDWSARILVALFGVAMVAFVWMMRRWLGRTGAFLTALDVHDLAGAALSQPVHPRRGDAHSAAGLPGDRHVPLPGDPQH